MHNDDVYNYPKRDIIFFDLLFYFTITLFSILMCLDLIDYDPREDSIWMADKHSYNFVRSRDYFMYTCEHIFL